MSLRGRRRPSGANLRSGTLRGRAERVRTAAALGVINERGLLSLRGRFAEQ